MTLVPGGPNGGVGSCSDDEQNHVPERAGWVAMDDAALTGEPGPGRCSQSGAHPVCFISDSPYKVHRVASEWVSIQNIQGGVELALTPTPAGETGWLLTAERTPGVALQETAVGESGRLHGASDSAGGHHPAAPTLVFKTLI